jgi:hypothetical protein
VKKLFSLLYLTLCTAGLAWAQHATDAPPPVPKQHINVIGIVLFLLVFFGSIIGFGFMIWYRHKKGIE